MKLFKLSWILSSMMDVQYHGIHPHKNIIFLVLLLPKNCLSVFDHFVGLALKALSFISNKTIGGGPHHHKTQIHLEKGLSLGRKF